MSVTQIIDGDSRVTILGCPANAYLRSQALIIALFVATAAGCGGSGEELAPPPPPVVDVVSQGLSALAANDYKTAHTSFCDGVKADPANSKAALGCAMTTYIGFWESPDIQAVLAATGQSPLDLTAAVFADGKFFDTFFDLYYAPDVGPTLEDFPYLPYLPLIADALATGKKLKIPEQIIAAMVANQMTLDKLFGKVGNLIGTLYNVHDYLLIVRQDEAFQMIIPKAFFHTKEDVVILPADVWAFDTAVLAQHFCLEVARRYEKSTINLTTLLEADGSLNRKMLVDQLNGAMGGPVFGTIKAAIPKDWSDLKPLFSELLSTGLEAIPRLQTAGGTELLSSFVNAKQKAVEKTKTLLQELQVSLNQGLTPLSVTNGKLKVNMQAFFATPPNAATLPATTPDPFDYVPAGGNVHYVEAFFKKFFEKVAQW